MEARIVIKLPNNNGILLPSNRDDEDDDAVDARIDQLWLEQSILDERDFLNKLYGYEVY